MHDPEIPGHLLLCMIDISACLIDLFDTVTSSIAFRKKKLF